MRTVSFQFFTLFFFLFWVWGSLPNKTFDTKRCAEFLYTHTHTHTLTHTLVMDCSTCTECWRSKRGDKVFSAAWAERLQGQMSVLHMRPGGLLSLCCHSKSHKPLLVLSLSRHPLPKHPSPCRHERTLHRQGSSLGCGQGAHPSDCCSLWLPSQLQSEASGWIEASPA